MKTTVELQDDLLERGKQIARREGVTLRALLEEGLQLAIKARAKKHRTQFRMKTFGGDGLTPEFHDASWEQIRGEIYRDRD